MHMGGSFDRLTVLPIAAGAASVGGHSDLYDRFRSFHSEAAECFKPEDREKLLGVIQSGFGGFSDFDHLVRDVLLNRISKTKAVAADQDHSPAGKRRELARGGDMA